GRTARATTNRIDEDSLRAAIEASLSLAHSQPKIPNLLPIPGKQRYRRVNRFIKHTAALSAEDRARAVRRACDLAVRKDQVAAGAGEKAHLAVNARELAPGRYTVILEPAAVLDLVGFLFYDFSATALADKRSCLNERMGKQLFGQNISITDDVYHPLQQGAPF